MQSLQKVLQISGVSPNIFANERHVTFQEILEGEHVQVLQEAMDWNTLSGMLMMGMAQKILKKHPDIDGVFGGDLGAVACMNVALQRGMKIPEEYFVLWD